MDQVLADIPHVFVYLDDVLITSISAAEHVVDVRAVLQRLQQHGLFLHSEKCVWGVSTVDYLGHKISATGISPLPLCVAAIRDFPLPQTKSQLQGFLGILNFYCRFLRGAASTLKPLTDATRGSGRKNSAVQWTPAMSAAFQAGKDALCQAACLAHSVDSADLALVVDASDHHMGGVLQQKAGSTAAWQPLSFYSCKLSDTEQCYSTFNRELLACVKVVRHFCFLLEG